MEQPDESQANQGYQNEQQIRLLERQANAAEKLNRLTCAAIVVTFLTLFIIGGGLWVRPLWLK